MVTPGVPPVPHVGGPISVGLPTVLIGGMPAARLNDMAVCVGPPDMIAMGSPTVQSGNMMNARLSDPTVHGGLISVGFPTVLIGAAASCFPGSVAPMPAANMSFTMQPDGSAVGTFGPGITIRGTPEFVSRTLGDLTALSALRSGRAIIDSINSSGRNVTIVPTGAGNSCGYTNGADRFTNPDGTRGAGTDSTVNYNPNREVIGDGSERWMHRSPAVGLGHELVHADNAAHGTQPPGSTAGTANRELQAMGLPPHGGGTNNENGIRSDLGEPARPRY
jgi:type VI secretion system secreted protein VgrG